VLDPHFPRNQQNQELKEHRRLLLHHLVDRGSTATAKGGVHLADRVSVEGVTRAVDAAATVSRQS
jgi:hypothetical protein